MWSDYNTPYCGREMPSARQPVYDFPQPQPQPQPFRGSPWSPGSPGSRVPEPPGYPGIPWNPSLSIPLPELSMPPSVAGTVSFEAQWPTSALHAPSANLGTGASSHVNLPFKHAQDQMLAPPPPQAPQARDNSAWKGLEVPHLHLFKSQNHPRGPAEVEDVSENRLYALLIGVDQYAEKKYNLKGAVKDVLAVRKFLRQQHLPVKGNRIELLKDKKATSENIVKSLQALCKNPKIGKGDPILIYYAGHGSNILKPPGWPAEGPHIQCLSPHDARVKDGRLVGVILDRTLGALLKCLAGAKGNNITVILDCCHSGSGTRGGVDNRSDVHYTTQRSIQFHYHTVDASYQSEHWGQRSSLLAADAISGLRSHIILAACGRNESAYENPATRRGYFTTAFLRVLEAAGTIPMTYAELIRRLGTLPSSQTPQCEGHDLDKRLLFDANVVLPLDPHCYSIDRSRGSYILHAGQIQGVGQGDVFALYNDREAYASRAEPFGKLVVHSVGSSTSHMLPFDRSDVILDGVLETAPNAVAALSRVASLVAFRVHVDVVKHPKLHELVKGAIEKEVRELSSTGHGLHSVTVVVSSSETATLSVFPDGAQSVGFGILDQRIRQLGLDRLEGSVRRDLESLRSALRSAAHFFHHLNSLPDVPALRNALDVRIWKLETGVDYSQHTTIPITIPVQPIPVDPRCGTDIFYPEVTRPDEEHPALYGIDVRNRSPPGGFGLFVWLFYFNCNTLEIEKYYGPPVESRYTTPPLRADMNWAMPLNYGDAGADPFVFRLPHHTDTAVGFLRIFVSSHHADLSSLAQEPVRVVERGIRNRGMSFSRKPHSVPQIWDAMTLPVVVKAPRGWM
ncbi:hypothetical protein PENSPDRAFT_739635 [Peniophora sp. CONT]|nr:hypothetical protein PENSPDRAFT_739635 [Peniophora sp. CONT]